MDEEEARAEVAVQLKTLADKYYYGREGITRNYEEAVDLYLQAADHGSSDAMVRLGYCNEVGKGVPEDYDIAFDWYQKASDNALAE